MKKESVSIQKERLLARILHYTKPYRIQMIFAIVSAAVAVAMTLLQPVIIGRAIDYIVAKGNVQIPAVLRYVAILGGITAVGAIFQWLITACTNALSFRTARDMRIDLFAKINRLPLKAIDSKSHGDLISRVGSDIDKISDGLLQGFTQLFSGIVTIVGTIAFMYALNPIIATLVVVMTPLSLFVASFIGKRSHAMFARQSDKRGEISGYVEEMLGGARVVQAFSHQRESCEGFGKINSELYDCGFKAQFYASLSNPCTRFVNNLVYAAVGIVGAIFIFMGDALPASVAMGMTAGRLMTFLMYSNQYTKPFNEITGVINEVQTAFAAARRVFAVMDEETEVSDASNAVLDHCDGTLSIERMSFRYVPEIPLLTNLNLQVEQGQKIAIVGPTGCGKTTLINLLMRFYDPVEGVIRVSGARTDEITRKSLRDCFGMVLQESWLFSGSIRDNIIYGKPDASDEEMIQAARQAGAHPFVSSFPDGYDTQVAENGDNLSQGQKQLLCIARIMLTRPPMLILDEATSSIDTRTELKIQRAFDAMMVGRTSFIVAHRLSTIREADKILVMKDGNIVEQGTHDQLIAQGGFYSDLYNAQFASVESF